jgi:hypothetical protein
MSSLQHKMIERSIEAIDDSSKKFRAHLASEKFHYDRPAYQPFFERLDAALEYVRGRTDFQPDDEALQTHLEVLRKAAKELLVLVQIESSKNLRDERVDPTADAHNQKWDMEIHDMKNYINAIGGHMELVHSSIGLIMRGGKGTPGSGMSM